MMFLPRQFQKPHAIGPRAHSSHASHASHAPAATKPATKPAAAAAAAIDETAARSLVLTLEQLFSSENPYTPWLAGRARGKDEYVHLVSIVECEIFAEHRPPVTQVLVKRALEAVGSTLLEIAEDGYHIRLRPGLQRQQLDEERTVYIEPSTPSLPLRAPGKIALELSRTLPTQLLPVVYTSTTARSWTLVTLAAAVSEQDVADRALWPAGWIVLTQKEWERRQEEYHSRRRGAVEARLVQPLYELEQEGVGYAGNAGNAGHGGGSAREFEKGLIVHIERLHGEVNKPSISSFVTRSVDRYLRKKEGRNAEKKKKEKESAEEKEENDEKEKDEGAHGNPKVQINYIDYKKGADRCYLRQSTAADSELIVAALKKRKRAMRDGNDGRGFKEKERFVVGRILEGEEEKLYWKKVHDTVSETAAAKKGRKGKGREQTAGTAGTAGEAEMVVDVDVRQPGKRPRLSTGSVVLEGKRKKLDS